MNASLRFSPMALLLLAVCASAQNHDLSNTAGNSAASPSAQTRQAEADARRADVDARNAHYVEAVERAALRRGVEVHWVNPPPVGRAHASADTFQTR